MDKILTSEGIFNIRLMAENGDKFYVNREFGSVISTYADGSWKSIGDLAKKEFDAELEKLNIIFK